ncbi:MAG: SufS family cysteine desulfurase [Candidatus Aenigmatarchaeota archaeon]
MFDVEKIREEFPILKRKINNKKLIYFDNAASTQKPKAVIEKIKEIYENYYANIHRGIHTLSQELSEEYENAREIVANFVNSNFEEIIFTRNTTESINLIAYSYALKNLNKNDEIIISVMEHHSNILPWQFVSKKIGCKLTYVGLNKDYKINVEEFKEKINRNTKIVSITHISNVLGSINDIEEIIKISHENEAIVIIDAAQSAPHTKIDVKKLDADFLVFSSHKMLGPTGIGILYGKKDILEEMEPFLFGGDMIKDVDFYSAIWNDLPWKFEAGTPNIVDAIAFAEAVKFLENIGMENIEKYLSELTRYFLDRFSELRKFKLVGSKNYKNRAPIFSFIHDYLKPHEIAKLLDLEGIAVRSGYHCAHPLMKYLNLFESGGTVRASLYLYNTKEEISYFFDILKKIENNY